MRLKLLCLPLMLVSIFSNAQDQSCDAFIPLGKYLAAGDVDALSAWFAPSLEVSIFGNSADASKTQAKQILRTFFKSYPPTAFTIVHQAGRENLKSALGDLETEEQHFVVTLFISRNEGGSFKIQQLKLDKK